MNQTAILAFVSNIFVGNDLELFLGNDEVDSSILSNGSSFVEKDVFEKVAEHPRKVELFVFVFFWMAIILLKNSLLWKRSFGNAGHLQNDLNSPNIRV